MESGVFEPESVDEDEKDTSGANDSQHVGKQTGIYYARATTLSKCFFLRQLLKKTSYVP